MSVRVSTVAAIRFGCHVPNRRSHLIRCGHRTALLRYSIKRPILRGAA